MGSGVEAVGGVTMSSCDRTEKVGSDMVIDGVCRWCCRDEVGGRNWKDGSKSS